MDDILDCKNAILDLNEYLYNGEKTCTLLVSFLEEEFSEKVLDGFDKSLVNNIINTNLNQKNSNNANGNTNGVFKPNFTGSENVLQDHDQNSATNVYFRCR